MKKTLTLESMIALIREEQGIPNNEVILESSLLEDDLGITGDDGSELLERIEKEYDLLFAGADGTIRQVFALAEDEYLFHSEGLSLFIAPENVKSISVGQLYEAARNAKKTPKPYRVHIIVDPHYGERISELPEGEPAWVIDSENNRPTIKAIWQEKQGQTDQHIGITSFRFDPNDRPEEWLISELETIDLHHGEWSHDPPYSILNVIGVTWSRRIKKELKKLGFRKYESAADGFIAMRVRG